ncbi:KIDINS220 [Symbiodinium natans]|uniref:KIDINS220 protein n=1 Tax=Symbiodinium natans TaxID=878477 RepID=A0A812STY2_9DINO|nr:KIDINS220 [Symbiodinium natans]
MDIQLVLVPLRDDSVMELTQASMQGNVAAVEEILQRPQDPNQRTLNRTAISIAASSRRTEVVGLLLEALANPNEVDDTEIPVLVHACHEGMSDVVSLLLQAKACPDLSEKFGSSALFCASMGGHTNCVQMLLQARADMDKADVDGLTALQNHEVTMPLGVRVRMNFGYNAELAGSELLRCLPELRAAPNTATNGATAVWVAADRGHAEALSLLLDARATADLADRTGTPPLLSACRRQDVRIASILLAGMADPNVADSRGTTALIDASDANRLNMVNFLLEAGAGTDCADVNGETALMRAAKQNNHLRVVNALLGAKADASLADKAATTPLMHAASDGQTDMVRSLLEAAAPPDAPIRMTRRL